ncbi:SH3 domain-binding protein 5-like [Homarus americanus]|uniref:SH3 domain-binding protein 5-like n=1 Tax=Homarus americanus TaxID=6706 RepID=A0A8J5JW08_HOMAM|nr:SH3 domain-binding protein 5-like [Homarus americanus]
MEEVDLSDQPSQRINSDNLSTDLDDSPDPRIQVELERLNTSTDTINKLEVDLDEARMLFRQLLADSTHRIDLLAKRLGKCVEQSRPYYDARINAKQRAMSQHAAAREMVFLAEEGLMQKGCVFDHTWQEMLNHATSKVNDAEREKIESAAEHRRTSALYHEAETRVKALQKELKRAIAKSRPYFELKSAVNQQLEAQKQQVRQLEESVARAKVTYAQALSNLETISDEIHRNRQSQLDLGVRGIGVGAESPLPPLQTIDGGLPLAAHPLHYAESTLEANTQEFKSLPGKLGPVAAPIMATVQTAAAKASSTSYSGASSLPATIAPITTSLPATIAPTTASLLATLASTTASLPTTIAQTTATTSSVVMTHFVDGARGSAVSAARQAEENSIMVMDTAEDSSLVRETPKDSSLVMEAGDVVVEEVDGAATSTDLTGWQVVGLGSPALSPATQYLTVEDRDSIVSDTESLASIEMLSDEAIAGLMLDEELAEASNSICTPLSTPVLDPPLPLTSSIHSWPTFLQNYVSASQLTSETTTSDSKAAQQDQSEEQCSGITQSLSGLELDSLHPGIRQLQPPHTLALHRDSSSDQSSPEDLTPGYAPLRDTPYSPEDFLPSSRDHSAQPSDEASSPLSTSMNDEVRDEPHRSSWVLENVPPAQK